MTASAALFCDGSFRFGFSIMKSTWNGLQITLHFSNRTDHYDSEGTDATVNRLPKQGEEREWSWNENTTKD